MSDSDDWENQLDSDNEEEKAKKEAEEKKKLPQEDVVDSAKVEKEKKEKAKKQQQELEEKRKKEKEDNPDKPKKKDLDKLFAERNKVNNKLNQVDTAGMTNQQKGVAMQMAQEGIMTEDLLGGDDDDAVGTVKMVKLNSEEDYKNFGKQTADILYKGSCPYRIENFAAELFRELPEHCNAKQINEIVKRLQTIYNQKQKDERSKDKNVKKEKPTLKYGGAKGASYERNNNAGMINDVMGGNEDEDDEYGDYGDEQGFRRENEANYDFM